MATGTGSTDTINQSGQPTVRIGTDVQPAWETDNLPDWVVYTLIPLLSAGQKWPEASESKLSQLALELEGLGTGLVPYAESAGQAARTVITGLKIPATVDFVSRAQSLFGEQTGLGGVSRDANAYAVKTSNFAVETQYSKLSINVAFWVTVVAYAIALLVVFFTAGSTAPLIGRYAAAARAAISRILVRLTAIAGRRIGVVGVARLAALRAAASRNLVTRILLSEFGEEVFFEEPLEEFIIDGVAQYQQIKMGTREEWDWKKSWAAIIGASTGAMVGMGVAGPVSRIASRVPGFAGRALNTGLSNVAGSPAGSYFANGLVYDQWSNPFTMDSMTGAFFGGVGRTGSISPFNPDVYTALASPITTLASAYHAADLADAARAGTGPGPGPGSGGPAGGDPSPTTGGPVGPGGGSPGMAGVGIPGGGTGNQGGGTRSGTPAAAGTPATAGATAPRGGQVNPDLGGGSQRPITTSSTSAAASAATPDVQAGATPAGTTPEGTASAGTAPEGTASAGTAPAGTAPEGTASAGTAPAGTAPEGTASAGTAPAGTAPEGTASAGTAPAGTAPEGTASAGTAPAGTAPDSTAPAGTTPDSAASNGQAAASAPDMSGQGGPAGPVAAGPSNTAASNGANTSTQVAAGTPSGQVATGPTTRTGLAESAMADTMKSLGLDTLLVEGGHVRLSRADGSVLYLPVTTLRLVRERLETRAGDGAGPHRLRAEAAAWLGIEVARADGRPSLEGAIQALHFLAEASPETGDAALQVATEIVLDNPNGLDQSELTEGARQLVAEANEANKPASAPADEYDALRSEQQVEAAEEIVRKADELVAELAGTASNPAGPGTSSETSAFSDLARQVEELTTSLAEAESGLTERRKSRARSAGEARKRARDALAKVEAAEKAERDGKPLDGERDSGAPARRHEARLQAKVDQESAARDLRIAARYEKARAQAETARSALVATSRALGRLTAHQQTSHAGALAAQVARLAHEAESQLAEYREAMEGAMPSKAMLPASLPVGPLPYMTKLTEKVNEALAAKKVGYRFTVAELETALETELGQMLSADGAVLRVAGVELKVKMLVSDLVEVLRSQGWTVAEAMTGRFIQGNHGVSTGSGRTSGWAADVDVPGLLGFLVKHLPAESGFRQQVEAIGPRVVLGGGYGRSQGESTSANFAGFVRSGAVLDNRGESSVFNGVAEYEFEVLAPGETGGRSVVRVADGSADDATRVEVAVSHAHIEHGPEETVQLTFDPGKTPPLPKNAPINVEGLEGALEKFRAQLLSQAPGLARNSSAQEQIRTFIVEMTPVQLAELVNNPQGLRQTISVPGQPDLTIVLKGKLKYELTSDGKLKLVAQADGTASTKQLGEDVGVGFSAVSGEQGASRSRNANGALGVKFSSETLAKLYHGFKSLAARLNIFNGSRSGSESAGLSAGGTAITPIVRRKSGHNQGVMFDVDLEITSTLHEDGKDKPLPPINDVTLEATAQLPENVAAATGFPFDKEAIVRDDSGERRRPDGSLALRDDPTPEPPPGRKGEAPAWKGDGPGQVRAVGYGHGNLMTDITGLQRQVAAFLRENGMLPKLDGNGEQNPVLSSDPVERASQEAMIDFLENQLRERLQVHYTQAVQGGIFLQFMHQRTGQPAEYLTLHVQLGHGGKPYAGETDAETTVTLYIGSDTGGSSSGESTSWGAGVGAGVDYTSGDKESTASVGGGYTGGKSRNTAQNKGGTANGVVLLEQLGRRANLQGTVPVTVSRVTSDWQMREVASTYVRVEEGIPSEMLSEDGLPQSSATIPTSDELLAGTAPLALDLGKNANLIMEISKKIGIRPDTPEFQRLVEQLSVDNLIGHSDFLHADHEIEIVVDTEGFGQRRWSVSIRGHVGESQIATRGRWLTSLIGFDMVSNTTSSGGQTSHTGSGSVSGGSSQAENPKIGAEAAGSHSANHGSSRASTPITGDEGLPIDLSPKVMLTAELSTTVVISEVGTANTETITTTGGGYHYSKPARDVLSLYAQGKIPLSLHHVSDVVEAFMYGHLGLERATRVPLLQRYLNDLAAARGSGEPLPTLAARHTPEVLLEPLMKQFGNQDESLKQEADPSQALDRLLAEEAVKAANPELAEIPESVRKRMGQSWPEQIVLYTKDGTKVDVHDAILKAAEAYAPGALASNPALRRRLFGDFVGRRWWGKIANALGPNGHSQSQPVRDADQITIRLQMDFGDGPVEVVSRLSDVLLIMQAYAYKNSSVTESSGTSQGGSVSASGSVGNSDVSLSPSGSAESGRSLSRSTTNSEQRTELARSASFEGLAKVRHAVGVTITVGESPGSEPAMGEQGRQGEARRPVVVELQGEMTRFVPQEMVGATEETRVPDPRPFTLPPSVKPDGLQADGLLTAVQNLLADDRLFGEKAARKARTLVQQNLNRMQEAANFRQMIQKDGGLVLTIPNPDKPGMVVEVTVRAHPEDVHVTVSGRKNSEIGRVLRVQHVTEVATNQGLRFSLKGLAGIIGLKYGRFLGWNVSVRTTVSHGVRLERSIFKRGIAASTEVPLAFDLIAELKTVKAGQAKPAKLRIEVQDAATGTVDLTVFEQELSEAKARRGAEGRRRWGWNLGDPEVTRTTERPGWRARWRSGPPAATLPSLDLDTLTTQVMDIAQAEGKAGSGVTPDALHRGIVEMAQWSLVGRWTPGTPIVLTATASAPGQMGPVTQARLLARGLHTDVHIELREPDGTVRRYRATSRGMLYSAVPDGGFASAFAPLPPELVTRADQAGVDLRALHNRSPEEGDFAGRVSEALDAPAVSSAAPAAAPQSASGPGTPQQPNTTLPSGSTYQPSGTGSMPARATSAPRQGVIRRFLLAPLMGARNEYVSARYNEYQHLAERWQKVRTACRTVEQQLKASGQHPDALEQQLKALEQRLKDVEQQLDKVAQALRERGQVPPVPPRETESPTVPGAPGAGGALANLLNRPDGEIIPPRQWETQYWARMRRINNTTGWIPPEEEECVCPPDRPCVCGRRPQVPAPRPGDSPSSPGSASPKPSEQPGSSAKPENPPSAGGHTVTTGHGSTLWEISEQVYGDGRYWKDIWERNREAIGSDPDSLSPDLELVLPDRPKSP